MIKFNKKTSFKKGSVTDIVTRQIYTLDEQAKYFSDYDSDTFELLFLEQRDENKKLQEDKRRLQLDIKRNEILADSSYAGLRKKYYSLKNTVQKMSQDIDKLEKQLGEKDEYK